MNSSNTDLTTDTSSLVSSELFCPPIQTWDFSETTLFKITTATTIIVCPVTILLNILVIIAVKRRRDLQNINTIILLASMAVAGVLVGAVSMPLIIISDVFVLVKHLNAGVFCTIAFVNDVVLYIGSCSSVYHLTVIAWERNVAITKWEDYKVIVTRGRVKKFARIAWLSAVLLPIPSSILKTASVGYKYLLVVDITCVLPGAVCLALLGYFYARVYFGMRKWETEKIRVLSCPIKAKTTKVAKTTAILTVVVLISFIPSLVFLLFGEIFPALRRSSFFRWSVMLAQLNSFFNPVLYCYRDRRFRDAIWEILASHRGNNRRIGPDQSLDDLQRIDLVPISRSKSMANLASNYIRETGGQVRHERCTICVDVHQSKIITTVPGPGIQREIGASPGGSHTRLEATGDQRSDSVQT